MDLHPWLQSLIGGLLIGCAATVLLLGRGQIAGISGALGGLVRGETGAGAWRLWFVFGLLLPALAWKASGHVVGGALVLAAPMAVIAGLLVGYGTRLGNGCTSGHGVCGLGNRSLRSLVAVAIFMGTAMLTVFVTRHLLAH